MADKMEIKHFDSKLAANLAIVDSIKEYCRINQSNSIKMLLSGGSSPIQLYELMAKELQYFDALNIGLVDERFVIISDNYSNEKLIRNHFHTAEITGLVKNIGNYEDNLIEVEREFKFFYSELDVAIIGMGNDGHFASIFPNDENSSFALQTNLKCLINTYAPSYPYQRITCSAGLLGSANKIILLIFGEEKKSILKQFDNDLPIHQFLNKFQVEIYYAN